MMNYHSGNQLMDPYLLFERVQIQPRMHVADFGCGRTGHIVFPAANAVGSHGVVYAIDIQKAVLEHIDKRSKAAALLNIHPVWADLERVGATAIPPASLDVIFIVNTLSQSNNRHAMLEEAQRLLKPKGRILISDWSRKGLAFGPSNNRFVDFQDIQTWARMRGFAVQEAFSPGKYHTAVVIYRNK